MTSLYDEGDGENDWNEHTETEEGIVTHSKEADHLNVVAEDDDLDQLNDGAWVYNEQVDLDGVDDLIIEWANSGNPIPNNESHILIDTNEFAGHNSYTKSYTETDNFDRKQDTLDVSDESGEFWLRVHAVSIEDNIDPVTSDLNIYQVELSSDDDEEEGNAKVNLSWTDNATNEDGYKIYAETNPEGDTNPTFPDDYTEIDDISADSTSYTDSDPADEDSIWYAVTAYSTWQEDGSAIESDEATVEVVDVYADVQTDSVTGVDATGATLNGEVIEFNSEDDSDVEAWFEWKQSEDSSWNETTKQTFTDPQAYDENVDLDDNQSYDFRARAHLVDDNDVEDTGNTLDFWTPLDLQGTVEDEDEQAVENATVYVTNESNEIVLVTTTDASGGFSEEPTVEGDEVHVACEYDDGGGTQKNALSYPMVK